MSERFVDVGSVDNFIAEHVVYKLYAQKRPEKMNEDDSPFYLAVNKNLKAESLQTKEWFKAGPVGINKLSNGLMKTMAQKAGINNERLRKVEKL